jgi:hypothetical protein
VVPTTRSLSPMGEFSTAVLSRKGIYVSEGQARRIVSSWTRLEKRSQS